MRMLIPLALAALLTLAPVKAEDDAQPACPDGQVETPEGCSDQAWVDDCPPDHLCAAGSDPHAYGDEDCIECSGPVDEPIQYGNDSCIDCTPGPVEEPETCLDGADDGEVCMEDVQYLGPPAPPASDVDTDEAQADADGKDAPAIPAALLLAALGALVLVLRRT